MWQDTREGDRASSKSPKPPVPENVQAHIQLKGVRLRVPLLLMDRMLSLVCLA